MRCERRALGVDWNARSRGNKRLADRATAVAAARAKWCARGSTTASAAERPAPPVAYSTRRHTRAKIRTSPRRPLPGAWTRFGGSLWERGRGQGAEERDHQHSASSAARRLHRSRVHMRPFTPLARTVRQMGCMRAFLRRCSHSPMVWEVVIVAMKTEDSAKARGLADRKLCAWRDRFRQVEASLASL